MLQINSLATALVSKNPDPWAGWQLYFARVGRLKTVCLNSFWKCRRAFQTWQHHHGDMELLGYFQALTQQICKAHWVKNHIGMFLCYVWQSGTEQQLFKPTSRIGSKVSTRGKNGPNRDTAMPCKMDWLRIRLIPSPDYKYCTWCWLMEKTVPGARHLVNHSTIFAATWKTISARIPLDARTGRLGWVCQHCQPCYSWPANGDVTCCISLVVLVHVFRFGLLRMHVYPWRRMYDCRDCLPSIKSYPSCGAYSTTC